MSALAGFQDWPDKDVGSFSHDEEQRILDFKVAGEVRFGRNHRRFVRSQSVSPMVRRRWYRDWRAKLDSLERAEGLR